METANTIEDIRARIRAARVEEKTIGFVPTMGALHEGHRSLIQTASAKSDLVVVSVFVNPTQFGPGEDYEGYPRKLQADTDAARAAGADVLFCPERPEIYDSESFIDFRLTKLDNRLCGASRPGHFNGVIQIVNKLFNIVQPDLAVFGQKDIQQFRILEQMTSEFNHNIQIVMGNTVRAADGLALSSRNAYLTHEERITAPALFGYLQHAAREISALRPANSDSFSEDIASICSRAEQKLNEAGFKSDYVEAVRYQDLQPVTRFTSGDRIVVAGAAYLGKARLIDNVILSL